MFALVPPLLGSAYFKAASIGFSIYLSIERFANLSANRLG